MLEAPRFGMRRLLQVPFKARYFDDDVQVVAVRQVLLMTVKVDVVSLNESPLSHSLQIKEQIVLIKKNYFSGEIS